MTPEHLRLVISNLPSAAEAAATPPMSNRAIADDIGLAEATVRRARETGASSDAPEREGRDGKIYRLPGGPYEPPVNALTPERATTGRFTAQVRNPPHLSVKSLAPPVDHLWEIYRAKKQISDRTLNRDDIERSRIAYNRWNARFNSDDPAVNEIPPGKAWGLY